MTTSRELGASFVVTVGVERDEFHVGRRSIADRVDLECRVRDA